VPRRRARIEIIPLIDVMFFLLASFMLVSLSMQRSGTPRMRLPITATSKSEFKPGILNIGIEKDGRVTVEKRAVSVDELDGLLRERLGAHGETPVYITADRAALHGQVSRVLQQVRAAGGLKIAFVTEGTSGPEGDPASKRNP
jgi:biopolymer transport protein ExbD